MSALPFLTPPRSPPSSPSPTSPPIPTSPPSSPSPSSPSPSSPSPSTPPPPGLSSYLSTLSSNPFHYGEFPTAGRLPHSLSTPFTESCPFKCATNAVVGAGLGVVWGVFTTSMGTGVNGWGIAPGGTGWVDPATVSTRDALRLTWREMRRRVWAVRGASG